MKNQEMIIFTRTFDLLSWLLLASNSFPKSYRHSFTRRMLNVAFDLREQLEEANLRRGAARLEKLNFADESLHKLRLYIRLANKLGWLSGGQYKHVTPTLIEIGKLIGGWKKTVR